MKIDLNCDLAEGAGIEAQIMPFISSANIACGFHAGDPLLMKETIQLCMNHKVAIGAHPSFPDRENFGRTNMELEPEQVYALVTEQILLLQTIAQDMGTSLHHVKPHGALYNMSAKDQALARAIASAVFDCNPGLILFGLSGSISIREAKLKGLKTAAEVFADRTYQDDGSLTPRTFGHALITDTCVAVNQAVNFAQGKPIQSAQGNPLTLNAETICLHGDGVHAVEFARQIFEGLQNQNIQIGYASMD